LLCEAFVESLEAERRGPEDADVSIDSHEPRRAPGPGAIEPGGTQLLSVAAVGGLIFGLLVGSVAVATGAWILAFSPALVFVNRFLLVGTRAKAMTRASWIWPVVSVIVAVVVVVALPSSAALPVAVMAALSGPALLLVTAVIDAHAAGTVWRH
jgi:hypothetical protein